MKWNGRLRAKSIIAGCTRSTPYDEAILRRSALFAGVASLTDRDARDRRHVCALARSVASDAMGDCRMAARDVPAPTPHIPSSLRTSPRAGASRTRAVSVVDVAPGRGDLRRVDARDRRRRVDPARAFRA